MLYGEFIAGTGCKDTPHNYGVYKDLEIIYMNTDKSKADIYAMGRALVDNSPTDGERELIARVREEMNALREEIRDAEADARRLEAYAKTETTRDGARYWRDGARRSRERARRLKTQLRGLKWVID